MKIGEFSKASGLPVSVLRYYDECGLLSPVFTDRFTGYRYYKREQLAVCCCISELKAVGFTLSENKKVFHGGQRETRANVPTKKGSAYGNAEKA